MLKFMLPESGFRECLVPVDNYKLRMMNFNSDLQALCTIHGSLQTVSC